MKNIYTEKKVYQLIMMFGIPSILALMIEMLTGVTDTAFAGNIPLIGESALAAMAFISPLIAVFTALQTLFAMSCGVLIAKYFNNQHIRKHVLIVGILSSIGISTIASLICFLFLQPILQIIGASGAILELATSYMKIQLISNIISSIGYTMTCAIRAIGYPKIEMIIITAAVSLNIVFNALFSFGFNMGIQGLALGTFISEVACVIFATSFLIKKDMFQISHKLSCSTSVSLGIEMFKIGFAQTVIQMLSGCTGFFVNGQLLNLGTSISVAAWNVAQRVYMILLMPIVGLSQGIQTIIAYFNGSGEEAKVNQVSSLTRKYCFIYGILALVLVNIYGEKILNLFGGNLEILALAKTILMITFSCFPLVGIFYTNITLLQVTGKEISAVVLALTRQVFIFIPLIVLLPLICSKFSISPVLGLFIATPVADCAVVLLSSFLKQHYKF